MPALLNHPTLVLEDSNLQVLLKNGDLVRYLVLELLVLRLDVLPCHTAVIFFSLFLGHLDDASFRHTGFTSALTHTSDNFTPTRASCFTNLGFLGRLVRQLLVWHITCTVGALVHVLEHHDTPALRRAFLLICRRARLPHLCRRVRLQIRGNVFLTLLSLAFDKHVVFGRLLGR